MSLRFKPVYTDVWLATLYRLFVALMLLWLTRFMFAWYNNDIVGSPGVGETLRLSLHGLRFDLSALLYFNVLFVAMRLVPFPFVYNRTYLRVSDWVYWLTNSLMLAINIGDTPYYRFTGARLRWSNVLNITTDSEIANITAQYAGDYWWAFLAVGSAAGALVWLSARVRVRRPDSLPRWPWRVAVFLVGGALCFLGMRGRAGSGIPLAIPDAAFVVKTPPEINVVLNSPFCIIRSLNVKKSNNEPVVEFFSAGELAAIRSWVHHGAPCNDTARRNIMTIIIESGGAEWLDGTSATGAMRGLMPFLDSLARQSVSVLNTFACSRSSCGGATAVLGGFPAFDPFYYMLSPYNKNLLDTPARLLVAEGWKATFYYGVKHGSFNIDQTAYAAGYSRIVDRDYYNNDRDYDGVWGIFDYPMAEYVASDLTALGEPFIAAWFTVSAHGPFTLPEGWDTSEYKHSEASPERGLEYTDEALRRFFSLASQQPWYDRTTFIITGDHGSRDHKGTSFDGDYIRNRIPLIVYTPDGSRAPALLDSIVASQHDIAATTLGLAAYAGPYVSVGTDVLSPDYKGYGIVRTDGGRYFVVSPTISIYTTPDLKAIDAVYDTAADPYMHNLAQVYDRELANDMLRFAQAFMQDFTTRLNGDKMSIANER